jgi:hypothetical protein
VDAVLAAVAATVFLEAARAARAAVAEYGTMAVDVLAAAAAAVLAAAAVPALAAVDAAALAAVPNNDPRNPPFSLFDLRGILYYLHIFF